MKPVSVYEFSDPVEYLGASLQRRKTRNPSFSLRAWSRQLGFKTPSLLSAILRRERRLNLVLAARIVEQLGLTQRERQYFDFLVLKVNARSLEEKQVYDDLLASFKEAPVRFDAQLETFRFIADWYHFVILEMVDLKGFDFSPRAIRKKIRHDLLESTIETAIQRLERLGLLERHEGAWRKTHGNIKFGDGLPSRAVKRHHEQMLAQAKLALTDQPIGTRDFRGSTLAIEKKDYPKAIEIIQEAHRRIQALASNKADAVYRLNTQFFSLTKEDL